MQSTVRKLLGSIGRATDIGLAAFVVCIVLLIIVPLPTFCIDALISISIVMSVTILLVTLYTEDPLSFNALPSLLLFMTLYRLALNIATTRMILTDAYAGQIIQTFGSIVTGGTLLIGFVLFLLLTGINFIVITKGSGRVAEVAARFTLDSLPGKQASIDADLSAGIIGRKEAKSLRSKIISEADFYGAMDGASKFVRGDAIAGVVITFVNIMGGMLVGMLIHHMSIHEIVQVYLTLTVGDGLVTQIPALLISVAAGIIVTRSSSKKNLGILFKEQIFNSPKVLIVTATILLILGLVPGMPFLIMASISVGIFLYAYSQVKEESLKQMDEEVKTLLLSDRIDEYGEDVASVLQIYPVEALLGEALSVKELQDQISLIRAEVAEQIGLVLPKVYVEEALNFSSLQFRIKLRGNDIALETLPENQIYATDFGEVKEPIESIQWNTLPNGRVYAWIPATQAHQLESKGYTLFSHQEYVRMRLKEILVTHAHEILDRQEVYRLINLARMEAPTVVEEIIPHRLSIGQMGKILKSLIREQISIRDIVSILEILADHIQETSDLESLTEYVRQGLKRSLTKESMSPDGTIYAITVDPSLEKELEDLIIETKGERRLLIPKEKSENLKKHIQAILDRKNTKAVILTSSQIRPHSCWRLSLCLNFFIDPLANLVFIDPF